MVLDDGVRPDQILPQGDLTRFDLGELQKIVEQQIQTVALLADDFEVLPGRARIVLSAIE